MTAPQRAGCDSPPPLTQPGFLDLEPSYEQIIALAATAGQLIAALHTMPAQGRGVGGCALATTRPEDRTYPGFPAITTQPGNVYTGLDAFVAALATGKDSHSRYAFGHIPTGGDVLGAVADFLALGGNPFTGVPTENPALVALDQQMIRWVCDLVGLPADTSGGVITTGASLGVLHALVAARHTRVRDQHLRRAVVYLARDVTHHSVAKAARIAGVRACHIRFLPTTPDLRLDAGQARQRIRADRLRGRRPFVIVATAGSTDTGVVDDLPALTALARCHRLWCHVDAAYGGGFLVTRRGRARLAGIEQADSVTLDAHKTWGLPYGTSITVVRDVTTVQAAFSTATGHYLPAATGTREVPDFSRLGLELTREPRGFRLWLPLYVRGGRLAAHLDQTLDLAELAYLDLRRDPALEVPWRPNLGIVAFHLRGRDVHQHAEFLDRLAGRGIDLSATTIGGRPYARMCVSSFRTRVQDVRDTLTAIHTTARELP